MKVGRPVTKLLQYFREEMIEVSTRIIMVKVSGYILKAEPTGYDVRHENKREVKDDIMVFGTKQMGRWRCH